MGVSGIGDVVVTGTFNGTGNLGGSSLTSAGNSDVFVAEYAGATGAHRWSRRAGGASVDKPFGIAMDDWGRVTVIGTFTGTASFGGSTLSSAGGLDVFLAQYAGADGAPVWSKRFGGPGDDYGNAIAADSGGNLVVTGQFATSIDFGGGALANTGAPDIYLAQLSPAGVQGWSRRYGSSSTFQQIATGVAVDLLGSPQYAYNYSGGVALDAVGDALTAGNFSGTVNLGGGPLTNAGGMVNQSYDLFVGKFAP